jgi:hypothetical protein
MITNKNYVDMKTDVGELIGDTTSSFALKIGKFLNFRYRDFMRRYPWKQAEGTTTITTVANQATYPLPWDFGETIYIWDNTNKKALYEKPEQGAQNDTNLVGNPDYFSVKEVGLLDQPYTSSTINIVSSSASDTTQTIFIRGRNSAGTEITETKTLNGTTNVTSANSYASVQQLSKSATSVGSVTITSNAGNSLAVIGPGQLQARYRIAHFYYIPTTTTSLVVRYKKVFLPMVNDYDYPIIDCADELMFGAQADAWRAKRQFSKSAALEAQYEELVQRRMYQQEQTRDITFDPTPYPRDFIIQ